MAIILLSIPSLATHNPSVSHSANAVTNGTFQDNYTFIPNAQNQTPIIIRANDTQLANLTVWQTSAGVPLASINATGSWRLGGGPPASPLLFIDNNTQRIGIGTTAPTYALDVNGTIKSQVLRIDAENALDLFAIETKASTQGLTGRVGFFNGGSSTAWFGVETNSPYTANSGFYVKSTVASDPLFLVNTRGDVGIGTASPTAKLHINVTNFTGGNLGLMTDVFRITGANATEFLFVNGTTGSIGIGTSAPYARLMVNGTTPALQVNDSAYLAVSGGRVGIGTASPNAKLHAIAGNVILESNSGIADVNPYISMAVTSYSSTAGTFKFEDQRDPQSSPSFVFNTYDGSGTILAFNVSTANVSRLAITQDGNVGIGTAVPYRRLQVNGTGGVSLETNESVYLATVGNQLVGIGTIAPFAGLMINKTTPALQVNDSAYLAVSGGRVGIGTASPNDLLVVNGSSADTKIVAASTSNVAFKLLSSPQSWLIQMGPDTPDYKLRFYDETNAATRMIIENGTGRVGIGTTAPFAKLMINGTTPALQVNDSTYLAVSGGSVGIGTTTPLQKLAVVGDANVTGTLYVGAQSFTTIDATGNLTVGGSGTIVGNVSINGTLWQPVYPSDDGLILYLPFSEGVGITTYDRSPYGNDGTLQNGSRIVACNGFACPNWTNGKYGNALLFKGPSSESGDYVNVSDSNLWAFQNNNFSIEMWTNLADTRPTTFSLISQHQNDNSNWKIYLVNGGATLSFRVNNSADINATVNFANNTWYYVVFVKGGTTGTFYVNGISRGSDTYRNVPNAAADLLIGAGQEGGPGYYWNGTIDEVRIYNRALSPDEIRTQYLGGLQSHGAIVADKFRIVNTTGSANVYVSPSGQVGIGATAPNSTLHVLGTGTGGGFRVTNQSNAQDVFFVNSTLGRVGINNLTPNFTLDVMTSATGGDGLRIINPASNGAGTDLYFWTLGNNVDYRNWMIQSNSNTDGDIEFWVSSATGANPRNGNPRLTMLSSGFLGIGTRTPGYMLSIGGNVSLNNSLYVINNGNVGIGTAAPFAGLMVNGTTPALQVNDSAYLAVSGGRVGIGTTSPGFPLTVVGDSTSVSIEVRGRSSNNEGAIRIFDNAGVTSYGQIYSSDSGIGIYSGLNLSGGIRFFVNINGSVGINTFYPNATLHILGNRTTGDGLRVTNQSNGAEVFFVNSTLGSVGIGTTTPAYLVDVVSTSAAANLQINGSDSNSAVLRLTRGDTGDQSSVFFQTRGTQDFVTGVGAYTSAFTSYDIGNATTPFITVRTTGLVGIGTTAPFAGLMVNGTTPALQVNDSAYLAVSGGRVGIGTISPNATLHVAGTGISGGFRVTNASNNLDVFFVNTSLGRVGINTTSPSAKLHVFGNSTSGNATDVIIQGANTGSGALYFGSASGPSIRYDDNSVGEFEIRGKSGTDVHINAPFYGTVIRLKKNNIGSVISESRIADFTGNTINITGSYDTNRFFRVTQPTITSNTSFTITNADSLAIDGAPISESAAAITNAYGLRIASGTSVASGVTNAYGLSVAAPTGATNNYAAAFTGGNVGIGTASPVSILDIGGNTRNITFSGAAGPHYILSSYGDLNIQTNGSGADLNLNSRRTILFNSVSSVSTLTERIRIDTSGNVGIGTTAPFARLMVNGTGGVSLETNESAYLAIGPGQLVGINTTSPRQTLTVVGDANVTGILYVGQQSFTNVDASGNLVIGRNLTVSNNVLFVSNNTGFIGMGNTTPNSTLHIQPKAQTDRGLVVTNYVRPDDIPDLALWLQADMIQGVSNGSAVSQWDDSSGNNRDATQTTAANQPTFYAAAFNGKPAVSFDGTSDKMGFTSFSSINHTVFWVAKYYQKGDNAILGQDTDANQMLSQVGPGMTGSDYVAQPGNSVTFSPIPNLSQSYSILMVNRSNLTVSMFRNGTQVATTQALTSNNVQIFDTVSISNAVRYFSGNVSEIIIYTRDLSKTEQQKIEGYLANKYGMTSELPAGHPYSARSEASGSKQSFTIDPDGNVGIGNATPGAKLDVQVPVGVVSAIAAQIRNSNNAGGFNGLLVNTASTATGTYALDAQSGGTSRLYVRGDGNVGIGTAVPYRRLQVNGTGGVSLETNESVYLATATGQNVGIRTTSPSAVLHVAGSSTENALNVNGTFIINGTTGNLGIGTTAPAASLHVNGTNPQIILGSTGADQSTISFRNNTNARIGDIGYAIGASQLVTGSTLGDLVLRTRGSDVIFSLDDGTTQNMILTSSGNVGIGATSPNATLHILGTGTAGGFRVTNQSNAYEAFFVNSTLGRIGIGTASPNYSLDVFTSAISGDGLRIINPATNVAGTDLYFWTLNDTANYKNWMIQANSNTPGDIEYWVSTATGANPRNGNPVLTLLSTGFLGVGTRTPGYMLSVTGNATLNNTLYVTSGNVGIGATTPNATLHVVGTGAGGGFRVTNQSNAYEAFFVNSTLGQVGIGTTSPTTKLEVRGGNLTIRDSSGSTGSLFFGSTIGPVIRWDNAVVGELAIENVAGADINIRRKNSGTIIRLMSDDLSTAAESRIADIGGSILTITSGFGLNRFTRIIQPTITAASALTVTDAASMQIDGAVISASSALITNSHGLRIAAGTSVASGVTNAYGLTVAAPAGATNNYAAAFTGGNVGIGTAVPYRRLQINGTGGVSLETNESVYLAIGSGQLVGINTTSPRQTLTVRGDANVTGILYVGSQSFTNIDASGNLVVGRNLTVSNNVLFVDNLTGRVGIWTTTPNYTLDVNGTFRVSGISATGGNITTSGGYTIHTFFVNGTFTPNRAMTVDVLVVGGGGGGGGTTNGGGEGGGGAGGYQYNTSFNVTAQAYAVVVGAGGASSTNGSNSSFSTIIARGGGRGGASGTGDAGADGGSGGGGNYNGAAGGAGTSGQGNAGGTSAASASPFPGSGGGGSSAVGENGNGAGGVAGAGGAGTANSINGSSVTYAGGGGGGVRTGGSGGAGGSGGGGAGATTSNTNGGDCTQPNSGSGGGGSSQTTVTVTGGAGCAGVVIIRYRTVSAIFETGNVGIGTTAPNATLHVAGSGVSGGFRVTNASNNLEVFFVNTSSGNVGIGTAAPYARLMVNGTTPALQVNDSAYLAVSGGRAGIGTVSPDSTLAVSGNLSVTTGAVLATSSGNVGIGTASPTAKLHAIAGRVVLESSSGIADVNPYISMAVAGYSTVAGTFKFEDQRDPQSSPSFVFNTYDGSGTILAFNVSTANVSRLAITQDGNVGIGTTAPYARLHVEGNVTINASGTGIVPLKIAGAQGQTANLTEWYNTTLNGTTAVAYINSTGSLFAQSKNFEIPHPLNASRKLVHSSLEGPEQGIYYRGEAQLADGSATIALPSYFEALAMKNDRTVQLTPKDGWTPLYVEGEVDGKFTVKTTPDGNKNQKFYWTVYAKRGDITVEK